MLSVASGVYSRQEIFSRARRDDKRPFYLRPRVAWAPGTRTAAPAIGFGAGPDNKFYPLFGEAVDDSVKKQREEVGQKWDTKIQVSLKKIALPVSKRS